MFKIKETLQNYLRVLKLTKKPSFSDWTFTAKICAVGLIVIGVVGFLLYLASVLVIG
jgi:protein transport protein SEC61 subunit gamma-like protein